ncbi:Agmatinase [Moorella thermoacetica]|uniref:Agmatinase n=1 Tax=Neomoorella thermoacetica TaxID=1525 RepID=A0AAC9HIX7_NEOTH|nr:agmatinase [Moorella thermoacetica]AOQ24769.1 Agmatinase [Moorella thermoacetica]TYL15693.1 Agmatinase [Moorella thermoacetica]
MNNSAILEGFTRGQGFLASSNDFAGAHAVLAGIPFDATTSFRPGTRWGPRAIRSVSEVLEEYSPYLQRELTGVPFYDAGDLDLPPGRVEASLERMEAAADAIFAAARIPFFMGGEHLVSYPLIRAAYRHYPDLAVLHFDAHADLREDYLGERFSHATVMRLVAEEIGPDRLYQFGIRSGTWGEFAYGQEETNFFMDVITPPLAKLVPELVRRPLYVTIDIDVVDPAFAPGTGTPEPGGCPPGEIFKAIQILQGANVVAFDLVEVCPAYDQSDITAILAAKILREAILAWGGKNDQA